MESKIVKNGLFEVYRDGTIFRFNENGNKKKCSIYNSNGYESVSTMVKGRQRNFYVHRIIGEAFVPNPFSKSQINHKDGMKTNNAIDNLEWVTQSENAIHAYENGLNDPYINGYDCIKCNKRTRAKDEICPSCKVVEIREKAKEETRGNRVKQALDKDTSTMTERQKEAVLFRKNGYTYQEIGEYLGGISRQAVEQLINQRYQLKETENPLIIKRRETRMTQKNVSDLMGINTGTYSNKESGKSQFTIYEANLLADIFNCTLDELFRGCAS